MDKIKGSPKSWVIWINSIFIILAEINNILQQSMSDFAYFLTPMQIAHVVAITSMINVFLRFKTFNSLADK